jgi:uncharacterized damage-inducible protein DinB
MKVHFEQFAAYNQWANARLYQAALALDDTEYRRNVGAFFKSIHGTLNHLLLTDRIWLKRLTGEGEHPDRLDAIIYEDRYLLAAARADEDERILRYVTSLDEASISGLLRYVTTSGKPFEQKRCDILAHLFNHQTHHRGQAHTILSICTGREPPPLDLLAMLRRRTSDQSRRVFLPDGVFGSAAVDRIVLLPIGICALRLRPPPKRSWGAPRIK